jgi:hypothetical protein
MHIPTWFIPSFYGDIRLEAKGEKQTLLHAEALTPSEADALRDLRDARSEERLFAKAWATRDEFNAAGIDGERGGPYRSVISHSLLLKAPRPTVERELTKLL